MTKAFVLCLLSFVLPLALDAAPISADAARRVADRWLRLRPAAHMKARFGARKAAGVKTFRADGEDAFHVVSLEGGGFVVVPADDEADPVVAFTDTGTLDEDPKNPLWALLSADLPQRLRAHRRGVVARRDPAKLRGRGIFRRWRTPHEEWKDLLSGAATAVNPQANYGQSSVPDVRVEPLIQSKWNQSSAGGGRCYNYYTPNNYVCGCVATAGAQLMRYHQFPIAAVSPVTMSCWINDEAVEKTMLGGTYDWASMPLVPNSSMTEVQRQAIGKLCYDAGVATRMNWGSGGSGACPAVLSQGFAEIFGYASSKCQLSSCNQTAIENAIFANLDAKCPVLLGISGGGGHEIVADGYGCYEGALYTHLNLGWGGSNDAWYLLPDVYTYTALDSIVYNVFPTDSGELLTGRVTDAAGRPVVGATVKGTKDGTTVATQTDAHGVYALKVSKGKWSVAVSASGGSKQMDGTVSVGTSKSTTLSAVNTGSYSYYPGTGSIGNRWGNDIVLPDYEAPKLESVTINGPAKLKTGNSATYVCVGRFSDGAVRSVATTSWSLSDNTTKSKKEWWDIFGLNVKTTTHATMDTLGILTAKVSGKTVTLTVIGTENDVSQSATKAVEIVDADPGPENDFVVPTFEDLRANFGSDSEIVRAITGEAELKAFNEFLVKSGVTFTTRLSDDQRRWAYRSYRMSALASVPELYEEEPELKISQVNVTGGTCSFTVSLTAGAREIALAREALADAIRVGTSIDSIDARPEIVAAPSADGANLVFEVKRPGTTQGFIVINAR